MIPKGEVFSLIPSKMVKNAEDVLEGLRTMAESLKVMPSRVWI